MAVKRRAFLALPVAVPVAAEAQREALADYVADRPLLQYVIEAELHRLWGGRPLFDAAPIEALVATRRAERRHNLLN